MGVDKDTAALHRWIVDPLYWAQNFLATPDKPYTPSKQQRDGWEAYRRLLVAKIKRAKGAPMTDQEKADARKVGVSIMSGHGTGKDAFAAAVGLHFQMMQKEPKVIVTAPAGPQLFTVIWPEFGKWINRSPLLKNIFVKDAQKIYLTERGPGEYFIKPRTTQPNATMEAQGEVLAGTHSYSVLFIPDEASGIPEATFKPIEGGMTDPVSIVVMIFNPTKRTGFAIESHTKNREDWMCLHWDAEALKEEKIADPQAFFWFDEQAQERLARKYGRDSDFYRVRVRGLPPKAAPDVLIPYDWAMSAVERAREGTYVELPDDPLLIGVDVGGGGQDPTVIVIRIGDLVMEPVEIDEIDSVRIGYKVEGVIREYISDTEQPCAIGVDVNGIGRGVHSYLTTTARLKNVHAINVGEETSDKPRFHRLRDEIWWGARDAFEEKRIVFQLNKDLQVPPETDVLIGELTTIKWTDENGGKIKVESKKDMKKRGLKSPNHADAFNITEYLAKRYVSRMPKWAQREYGRRRGTSSWKMV